MSRIPMIAGNWKMNCTYYESLQLVQRLSWKLIDSRFNFHNAEVTVIPPFTSLRSVQMLVESEHLDITYGAQTVSELSQGAFTGDISAQMLEALGCSYVIIGHSERRKYHPEDDAEIVDKVRAVLSCNMQPILCVGESFGERRKGIELEYAVGQVHDVIRDLSDAEAEQLIIAYEPVWAIGTGMTATPAVAQEAAQAIREHLAEVYNNDLAQRVRILYGGSVSTGNAYNLMQGPDVDGFLVGGASLSADDFADIALEVMKYCN